MSKKLKVLMSGGGTGGHIFPAVAIAQEIKNVSRCRIFVHWCEWKNGDGKSSASRLQN
jgi:UDP-N-acetylglucosamine:LPS N-acetylglucosamine transferase